MSRYVFKDRTWETSTTLFSGTGNVSLNGARGGYRSFSSVLTDGDTCIATITNGTDFEVAECRYNSSGNTITRLFVFSSSNSDNTVTFPVGQVDVFLNHSSKNLEEIKIENSFSAAETISGTRCVGINQSGGVQVAMASVSGRMPAIGVVFDSVLSGATNVRVYNRGSFSTTTLNFSGYIGKPFYVGTSGELVTSGAPANSGNIQQVLGIVTSHSGAFVNSLGLATSGGGGGGGGVTDGSVLSGSIASGQVSTYHFASGATVNRAQFIAPFVSGTAWTVLTEEVISGGRAVALSQSGKLRIAMASISGRMPAIGVVTDNIASGIQANVYTVGVFQTTSGMADYSGYLGQPLYVGRSGHITTTSGSYNSGGLLSGDVTQSIGFPNNSGSVLLEVSPVQMVLSQIFSGDIGSGQIGQFHHASGCVTSGHIASGVQQLYPQVCIYAPTNEPISGGRAVALTISGLAWMAQTAISGRMPAVGYTINNTASGQVCEIIVMGIATPASGLNNTRPGRPVFVNSSGQVGNISGGFLSGGVHVGALSGAAFQTLGFATHSGQIFVQPSMDVNASGNDATALIGQN